MKFTALTFCLFWVALQGNACPHGCGESNDENIKQIRSITSEGFYVAAESLSALSNKFLYYYPLPKFLPSPFKISKFSKKCYLYDCSLYSGELYINDYRGKIFTRSYNAGWELTPPSDIEESYKNNEWIEKSNLRRYDAVNNVYYYTYQNFSSTSLFLKHAAQDFRDAFDVSAFELKEIIKLYGEVFEEIRTGYRHIAEVNQRPVLLLDEIKCYCNSSAWICELCRLNKEKADCQRYQDALDLLELERKKILPLFDNAKERMTAVYKDMYDYCILNHGTSWALYQRGLIHFHKGHIEESLDDIRALLDTYEKNKESHLLPPKVYFDKGVIESELGLYQDAITSLSEAIKKDPKNKDAYFERAAAYFESGEFDQALKDYLSSEIRPAMETAGVSYSIDYAKGLIEGIKKGASEAFGDGLPVWAPMLNVGLWALASSPSPHAKVISGVITCVAAAGVYLAADQIASELKELVTNWDVLSENERGELSGYIVGKYGIDIFCAAGSVKLMEAYQSLKRANNMLTFEMMLLNEAQVVSLKARYKAIEKFKKDKEYIKKYFGRGYHPEYEIRDNLQKMGYQIPTRPAGIPENFLTSYAEGCGVCYHDPINPRHEYIRLMPGNPNSSNSVQQTTYIVHARSGKAIDEMGTLVPRDDKKAHIAVDKYIYRMPER